jgi:hypothetical protein
VHDLGEQRWVSIVARSAYGGASSTDRSSRTVILVRDLTHDLLRRRADYPAPDLVVSGATSVIVSGASASEHEQELARVGDLAALGVVGLEELDARPMQLAPALAE